MLKKFRLGSPQAMKQEPPLEHPDYYPPRRIRDEEDTWVVDDNQRCFCDAWNDGDYVWLRSSSF